MFVDWSAVLYAVSADEKPVSLMFERDGVSYVLCTLQHGKHFQQSLDLEFASGEELTFFIKGKGLSTAAVRILEFEVCVSCVCVFIVVHMLNVWLALDRYEIRHDVLLHISASASLR